MKVVKEDGKVRPIFDQFSRKHFTVAPRAKTPRTIRPLTYATTSFVEESQCTSGLIRPELYTPLSWKYTVAL
ncbi:hypothetical protein AcW1_000237 [Taiwanofungus camphoratus]|nr:hypothetical protein AcV7_000257 [Antrodia cinnamomea]KAI0963040.1 hypothetical protein AcW1_000237 [Antrodia cinnamomea]